MRRVGTAALCALMVLPFALALWSAPVAAKPKQRSLESLRAVEKLEPTAMRRWPDSFGGLWLGRGKVFIAFTERGSQRVARLGHKFPRPKALRAVQVDDSLRALRELQGSMIADRAANPVKAAEPGSGRLVPLLYDLDIDVMRNTTVAIVEQTVSPELITAFTSRYGADVVVERGALMVPQACSSRFDCAPFLRAGLAANTAPIFGAPCSTAFNVTYPPDTRQGILSAAHCGFPEHQDLGASRFHKGGAYGQVVFDKWSGPVDFELHTIGNGFFGIFPLIYASDANKGAHVNRVGTYDGLAVGSTVCKAGWKTGETCGEVFSKDYSPAGPSNEYPADAQDYIRTNYCSDGGDSGAAIYTRRRAINLKTGKHHAVYTAQGVHSGGVLPCDDPGHRAIFGHIEFIQDAYPLKILTDPN